MRVVAAEEEEEDDDDDDDDEEEEEEEEEVVVVEEEEEEEEEESGGGRSLREGGRERNLKSVYRAVTAATAACASLQPPAPRRQMQWPSGPHQDLPVGPGPWAR